MHPNIILIVSFFPTSSRRTSHAPPQTHLAGRRGQPRPIRGDLPHTPDDHRRSLLLEYRPIRRCNLVLGGGGRGRRAPPVERAHGPEHIVRRLRGVCRGEDARTHPLEVRHPRAALRRVRGLLPGVLVRLLHGVPDGEAHGRLRELRRPLLQRDRIVAQRPLDSVRGGTFSIGNWAGSETHSRELLI